MNKRSGFHLLAAGLAVALTMAGCSKAPETTTTVTTTVPPAAADMANVSDVDVTEHVKTALQQNDALKGFDITVVTLKGDVRLVGVVDSQAQIDEALKIARAANGAHSIHDELRIKQ
jgi:osmotically-inducible protein OsmY